LGPGDILEEAEIGPSGGTIETEKITLTVPPGTFTATYSVQIDTEQVYRDDFGGNTVTPVYQVSGIPAPSRTRNYDNMRTLEAGEALVHLLYKYHPLAFTEAVADVGGRFDASIFQFGEDCFFFILG